jgi:hypothetical protein
VSSVLAWLDYSEDDRRRIREVIDLFREQDTRDELGLGAIRDAISAILFPGTSTVQTRPRYFLFVPWAYQRLERERVPSSEAAERARRLEIRLIYALIKGGDYEGVIGIDVKRRLKRLPSSVYWGGLRDYGIRLFRGSIDDYHRSLDRFHRSMRAGLRAENEELYERASSNWHPSLPEPPHGLFEETTMTLRRIDAEYLRERIITTQGSSMLARLLDGERLDEHLVYPWDCPHPLPEYLAEVLNHARCFSEVMHGSSLLYNLMLAQHGSEIGMENAYLERVDRYLDDLDVWAQLIEERSSNMTAWDRQRMWDIVYSANPRVTTRTHSFIDSWIALALGGPDDIANNAEARKLIDLREFQMKGALARLRNRRQLEMWSGAAGTRRLDFRWPTAQRLVRDVQEGLADA